MKNGGIGEENRNNPSQQMYGNSRAGVNEYYVNKMQNMNDIMNMNNTGTSMFHGYGVNYDPSKIGMCNPIMAYQIPTLINQYPKNMMCR